MNRIADQQVAQSAWSSATAAPQPGQVGGMSRFTAKSGNRRRLGLSLRLSTSMPPWYRGG